MNWSFTGNKEGGEGSSLNFEDSPVKIQEFEVKKTPDLVDPEFFEKTIGDLKSRRIRLFESNQQELEYSRSQSAFSRENRNTYNKVSYQTQQRDIPQRFSQKVSQFRKQFQTPREEDLFERIKSRVSKSIIQQKMQQTSGEKRYSQVYIQAMKALQKKLKATQATLDMVKAEKFQTEKAQSTLEEISGQMVKEIKELKKENLNIRKELSNQSEEIEQLYEQQQENSILLKLSEENLTEAGQKLSQTEEIFLQQKEISQKQLQQKDKLLQECKRQVITLEDQKVQIQSQFEILNRVFESQKLELSNKKKLDSEFKTAHIFNSQKIAALRSQLKVTQQENMKLTASMQLIKTECHQILDEFEIKFNELAQKNQDLTLKNVELVGLLKQNQHRIPTGQNLPVSQPINQPVIFQSQQHQPWNQNQIQQQQQYRSQDFKPNELYQNPIVASSQEIIQNYQQKKKISSQERKTKKKRIFKRVTKEVDNLEHQYFKMAQQFQQNQYKNLEYRESIKNELESAYLAILQKKQELQRLSLKQKKP